MLPSLPVCLLLMCSGLHRHVTLLAKPAAACITDYSVKTPLTFHPGEGRQLQSAGLDLTVHLELADKKLLEKGRLGVTADLLLPDGSALLQEVPATLQPVSVSGTQQEPTMTLFVCLYHIQ